MWACRLGYEQERGVPQEECPKPLTIKEFDRIVQEQQRGRVSDPEMLDNSG